MKYSHLAELYEKIGDTPGRLDKTEILAEFLKKIKHEDKKIIYLLRGRIFPDYDSRETGISEQLAIKALSKATGVQEKEIVKLWRKIGDLGKVASSLPKKQSTLSSKLLDVEKVLENLGKLPELQGKGTVEKKMILIAELFANSSHLEAKYIMRTLLGDLRIGLGDGVLRDAIVSSCLDKENKQDYVLVQEAYDLATDFALVFDKACKGRTALSNIELEPGKPVKVMLFPKVTSIEEAFEVVGKPAFIEFKYDGFRMMINKDEQGNIKIFTRRLDEVTKQFPEVVEYIKKYVQGKTFILDGEAVGFDLKTKKYKQFQDISQRIKRKYDINSLAAKLPIELNIFDIIYYNGKNLIKTPFIARRELIEKIIKENKFKIVLARQIITDDKEKAEEFYKQALKEGQEGVMIKGLNAPYKPGARVGYGVKFKPSGNEFDLVITGAEYGTGKRAGWLTSFDISCQDSQGKLLEIGKVSTGLKEIESQGVSFIELTNKLKPLIKKTEGRHVFVKPEIVIAVTYQNIQVSPSYASSFALRFPRFTALRNDRGIHDIASLDEIKKEHDKQTRNIQGLG